MKMTHLGRADWEDTDNIQNLIDSYSRRYGEEFWKAFFQLTGPEHRDTIADFGCGPGLFLVDAVKHYNANRAYGFDMSKNMLKYASHFIQEVLEPCDFVLEEVDFDKYEIPVKQDSIDLAFSGYMLHEIQNPGKFVKEIQSLMRNGGVYIIFDFISGNPEAFVNIMTEHGMPRDKARKRYPHMCKHSLSDLLDILKSSGFSTLDYIKLDEIRAIVKGIKA
jgi:ubiquinone/menaquinone biosynthesis C-methylase UbiE